MELKDYQQTNLDTLDRFLSCVDKFNNTEKGFYHFWQTNNPPLTPFVGSIIEPYKDNVTGAPHICHKVPTGGGKTFIASAALRIAIDHIKPQYKVVVWLVPSNAILEQTLRNLRNKQHPYRQRIDTDFQNRVEVFDKQQVLMGQGFTLTTVRENLCILVLSFDSLRTNNKEGRKVYQENGYLQSFASLVAPHAETDEEIQLMKVLQAVHPIVIVDESHNATSKLSEQMLNDLHPSLVLDLTATPKKNSNIICFTDALKLRKNNMVKLPVIVYNHAKKTQVIDSALHLQRRLEQEAKKDASGNYIRPIVLFQAEAKQQGAEDRATFEKLKQQLLDLKIPEEQIKIKTAETDELKGIDLMSPDCPVRYIITINALKEGWDCPFAYILASLADKSSSVDVEQIVGRVLRLPYARRNQSDILNLSYVLTASAKFQETLDKVVLGLNHAGFSNRDYRAVDVVETAPTSNTQTTTPPILFPIEESAPIEKDVEGASDDIDITDITFSAENNIEATETLSPIPIATTSDVENILQNAKQGAEDMENKIKKNEANGVPIPPELAPQMNTATIKSTYTESAAAICLPMFYIENTASEQSIFERPRFVKLENEQLLKEFKLSNQDTKISFTATDSKMYTVDIDANSDEHIPVYRMAKDEQYNFIMNYIRQTNDLNEIKQRCAGIIAGEIGKMYPLGDKDIRDYINRIFANFTSQQLDDFANRISDYTDVIKKKIISLENNYKEQRFQNMLDVDDIITRPAYSLPKSIQLNKPWNSLPKMLYTKEETINGFEREVISLVAIQDSIEWWTRNVEKRGFYINGFINHYPDFIIKTKKGKIVLLETKGDHLDAEQKILLGNLWAIKAGNNYRYCLVYNTRKVEGAYTKEEFIDMIKKI